MDWLSLLSVLSPKSAPRVTHVTVPHVSAAAIKKYDAMVIATAAEKIKAKLEPISVKMSEEERQRTIEIVEIVMTEMCKAVEAMETVRGRK